jgi:hypothetical protein
MNAHAAARTDLLANTFFLDIWRVRRNGGTCPGFAVFAASF